jgi:hypothetical protein
MAEVVYAPALFAPLLATVQSLNSPSTCVLLGYETRHTSDADFFRQMDSCFTRTAVPPSHYHKADGVAARPDISVFQLTPRLSPHSTQVAPMYEQVLMWLAVRR